MKGYKIVYCKNKGGRPEYFSVYAEGKAQVQYFFDQFVEPPKWLKEKGFWLNCFSNKKIAIKEFEKVLFFHKTLRLRSKGTLQLIQIEYKPSKIPSPFCCILQLLSIGRFETSGLHHYPTGTRFASKIKLVNTILVKSFEKQKQKIINDDISKEKK